MQDTGIFHVFQKVCLHAWVQHASFPCKVNWGRQHQYFKWSSLRLVDLERSDTFTVILIIKTNRYFNIGYFEVLNILGLGILGLDIFAAIKWNSLS